MAHATAEDLKDLEPLLTKIRTLGTLKEKSRGCFYLKAKAVLHFHVKAARRFAHVYDGKDWHEVDILFGASPKQQMTCFGKISKLVLL
ncbi:hypothetical protein BH10BDE1_BH10BDE1_27550 [soil metagenome]